MSCAFNNLCGPMRPAEIGLGPLGLEPPLLTLQRHSFFRTFEAGCGRRFKPVEYFVIDGWTRATPGRPRRSLIRQDGSRGGQSARRGALPPQPPQNQAMEHK